MLSVHMRNSFVTVSVPLLVNDPKGLFTLYEFITVTVNVIIMTVVPLIFMDTVMDRMVGIPTLPIKITFESLTLRNHSA